MELTIMTYRKSMSDAIREVQESTIKPYVSISSGGQYNVLDKEYLRRLQKYQNFLRQYFSF